MKTTREVDMGREYVDVITGFRGVCTGRVQYISGCDQALLAPTVDKEGKPRECHWFDVQRLRACGDTTISLENGDTPGCDMAAPIR